MNGRSAKNARWSAVGALVALAAAAGASAQDRPSPGVQVRVGDLAGFYKSLKSSPLGTLYKNDKVKDFLGFYLKPMGLNLTGAKNTPAHDALDRLLTAATGPAVLAAESAGTSRGALPPFAARLNSPKAAQTFKDVRTLMKSAPAGALEEKEGAVGGAKSLTYVVKPAEKGKPHVRFPFERISFIESGGTLVVTNMDAADGLRLAASETAGRPAADTVEIALGPGGLRSLARGYSEYVPGCAADIVVRSGPAGLSASLRFPGVDPEEKPFRYLGAHPAMIARPAIEGAHLESAARLDLPGVWNAFWDDLKRRAPAEHFAARATLMEIEKNLGVRVAEDLIPSLEGSVAIYETGAGGDTAAVFKLKDDSAVKKALGSLSALGGKTATDPSGVYEIRMGGPGQAAGAGSGTFFARLAGGFLVVSAAAGPVGGFPASPAISASSGPVSLSANVHKAFAAAYGAWQKLSIVKKQRGPQYFPPSLLAGRFGKLTVSSSRKAGAFAVDIDLRYAR